MQAIPTLSWQLRHWTRQLESCSDSARIDAETLLRYVSGMSDTQLILHDNEPLEDALVRRVDELVAKRCQGHPIAYLTGEREFYSLRFLVNSQVLIPRPETEMLVDLALELIAVHPDARVLDMGTGSGAIALSIAHNAPQAQLVATDIEAACLELAQQNAELHGIEHIEFLLSHWFTGLANRRFDLIVSNPPYIDPAAPHLDEGDLRFEPPGALVAADRGIADITDIIASAPQHLVPGGVLALEHGYDQGQATRIRLQQHGFSEINTQQDLGGHERLTTGQLA